jgi:hypothetical protein
LIALALAWPRSLTQVYRLWMSVGEVLGWINSRIILGALFYLLFTPLGLCMRLRGKDSMRRTLAPEDERHTWKHGCDSGAAWRAGAHGAIHSAGLESDRGVQLYEQDKNRRKSPQPQKRPRQA